MNKVSRQYELRHRLRAARRMRWHSSAAKAAAAIGMATGTYSMHEYGQARISDELIARLADSFGVTFDFLRDGVVRSDADADAARFLGMDEAAFKRLMRSKRLMVGDRLRDIRLMRKFRSAAEAARAFGWVPQTYHAHEAGARVLAPAQIRLYAFAYDVPAEAFERSDFDLSPYRHPSRRRTEDEVRVFARTIERTSRPPSFAWLAVWEDPIAMAASLDQRLGPAASPVSYLPVTREMLGAWALVPDGELAVLRRTSVSGARTDHVLRLRHDDRADPANGVVVWRDASSAGCSVGSEVYVPQSVSAVVRLPVLLIISYPDELSIKP